jgi:hypothetical protein
MTPDSAGKLWKVNGDRDGIPVSQFGSELESASRRAIANLTVAADNRAIGDCSFLWVLRSTIPGGLGAVAFSPSESNGDSQCQRPRRASPRPGAAFSKLPETAPMEDDDDETVTEMPVADYGAGDSSPSVPWLLIVRSIVRHGGPGHWQPGPASGLVSGLPRSPS